MRGFSSALLLILFHQDALAFAPSKPSNFLNQRVLFGTLKESGDVSSPKKEPVNGSSSSIDIKSLVDDAVDSASGKSKKESTETSIEENKEGVEVNDDTIQETELSDNDATVETVEHDELDIEMMKKAIQMAQSSGGERGSHSPFPKPVVGAVIATKSGKILGSGKSDYEKDAVLAAIHNAGVDATPLSEWCVTWPKTSELRKDLRDSTLYVTLEPSAERHGTSFPPITQLIQMSGIPRVVIGSADPIPELSSVGARTLHAAGLSVTMGVVGAECQSLIQEYSKLCNTKLQRMARNHSKAFGRPLGFLHCSVVDSDDIDSFARNGNAFGKDFGGQTLSFRDFGSYELAPPPESIWAAGSEPEEFTEVDDWFDFEDEKEQDKLGTNPMMPWYEQVDAVVATFPREGRGPADDNSMTARLNGLKWLATSGDTLPANVERILVMDATDLPDLPLSNDDPNLPDGVDVEAFWAATNRKKSRILLRYGENAQAIAAAKAASDAAAAAAKAAEAARLAIESGDSEVAAEAALGCQQVAMEATLALQKEMEVSLNLKQRLQKMGVQVEVIKGGEPIDVMNHLGKRNGYKSVVWRAGCWGQRGVKAIIDGAFQWVSAHLAVDAVGGKFWQLMLAERAVQAACGQESKVKVLSDQEDISLEYCDAEDANTDCVLTVNGRPIRHVRLDCRVLVVDPKRPVEYVLTKTAPMKEKLTQEAPWFL